MDSKYPGYGVRDMVQIQIDKDVFMYGRVKAIQGPLVTITTANCERITINRYYQKIRKAEPLNKPGL